MRDIRKLALNLLRALDALLDERSVTKAAERLALTQPAVSGVLARLRESFDAPLFMRNIAVSVTGFLLLTEVLLTTDLIAVVPRRLVAGVNGLVLLKPPIDIPGFSKMAVWHERTHYDPGHQWARALLIEARGALDGTKVQSAPRSHQTGRDREGDECHCSR